LYSWPKNSKKRTYVTFLKHFLNAIIKNIKSQNIPDIIEISKFNGFKKSRHDVSNGTTQECVCPLT
jgi:hypothetical protein